MAIKDKYNQITSSLKKFYELKEQPANSITNKGGIYFDVLQEHTISIQNQITDNYIEDNSTIQDHIAKSPITVSLRGLSGDVVFVPPTQTLNGLYNTINDSLGAKYGNELIRTDKLTAIPALLPPVDNITQLAKNAVQYVEASYKRYEKIYKTFTSEKQKETRLQAIYRQLLEQRENNTLFTIETPYSTFENMAIQSITLHQGNENYITDIELTLKQIKITTIQTTQPDTKTLEEYNSYMRTQIANLGKALGKSAQVSLLKQAFTK